MEDNPDRKLVKTYPGLPPGAGIYDDGCFYNCAPGQKPQTISRSRPNFYHTDPETRELIMDPEHGAYESVREGLRRCGYDLAEVKTEEELVNLMSVRVCGLYIAEYIHNKFYYRKPKDLQEAVTTALIRGEREKYERLQRILDRQQELGLRVITGGG